MGRTHLLAGACVALTVSVYLGCAGKPSPRGRGGAGAPSVAQRNAAKPQAAERDSTDVAQAPAAPVTEVAPKSIAQHAEVYAQNLESMLSKRAAARQSTSPAVPAPAPAGEPEAIETQHAANTAMAVAPAQQPASPSQETRAKTVEEEAAPAAQAPPAPRITPPQPRPQVTTRPIAPAPQAPAQAPSPAPSQASAALARGADDTLSKLAARARDYPRDVAAQLDYQLLQFLRDESVPELAPLATLPAEDRELLTALIDGLANFRNGLRAEANMLQSRKVSPLLEMGDRLRSQGELTLPVAALCTKVERFGVYDPMEPAQFKAGVANEAILYCEVANFSSQIGANRMWETRLKHESVLYSETGLAVWQDKADDVTDMSRNRRHDFYVVEHLRVPPMPIGRYLLKVTVTDLQVNRVAEVTVPIQVVAQ